MDEIVRRGLKVSIRFLACAMAALVWSDGALQAAPATPSPEKAAKAVFQKVTSADRADLTEAERRRRITALLNEIGRLTRNSPGDRVGPGPDEVQDRALLPRKTARGLALLESQLRGLLDNPGQARQGDAWLRLREVSAALANDLRPPAPRRLDFFQLPFVFWDYHHNPMARGGRSAANVATSHESDRVDPPCSSFWAGSRKIAEQDLFSGFGRPSRPDFSSQLWRYKGPKTSYGGNPGFVIEAAGQTLKVKFAETASEPFTARIFAALGYNVEATDYVPGLKIAYDRRLFQEFHQRKQIRTRITVFGVVPVYTIDLQKRYDPFAYVTRAVLRDGTELSGRDLKKRLLTGRNEGDPRSYRPEVESAIEYLVTVPANVQAKDRTWESIGPWTFSGLGHEDLRELRGAGLLAAWVGWFDSRFENTRLKVAPGNAGGGVPLKHFFTDLGGGLGDAVGPLSRRAEAPDLFPWTFTEVKSRRRVGAGSFRIVDFQPIEDTGAFWEMTVDDARWMARRIGQLTETQIISALVASGLDSAKVKYYSEKLLSRRDQMIRDLDLAPEIPLLRPNGTDRQFSYDPVVDGVVRLRLPGGTVIEAQAGDLAVVNGRIVEAKRKGRDSQLAQAGLRSWESR